MKRLRSASERGRRRGRHQFQLLLDGGLTLMISPALGHVG